jgi:3-oxoacyl-[acyl-carrier protein] reductase
MTSLDQHPAVEHRRPDAEDVEDSAGRVAVVFGASRGIGRACATALAADGLRVVLSARNEESLRELAAELPGGASVVAADLSEVRASADVVDRVLREEGSADVLVVNGGGPAGGNFASLPLDAWEAAFRSTVMSAVEAIKAATPSMVRRGFGRIIVIGSSSVRRPIDNLTLSNVYRPALNGLVKSLAVELAPDGITVNMVSPGRIDTERVRDLDRATAARDGQSYEEVRQASQRSIPIGRYGRPEDVANVVAFLAGSSAGYVTGQTILVDGAYVPTIP